MKSHAKPVCWVLLGWVIFMMPTPVRAEPAEPLYDRTRALYEQIQDLYSMQRNVEECYRAEKRISMVTRLSQQDWRGSAELDGKLMKRVLDNLAGTPEYAEFIQAYRILTRRPDYKRLYTDELFAEYIRLLESGRTRLMTQWKVLQESVPKNSPDQLHGGFRQGVHYVPAGYPLDRSRKTGSRRAGPVKREGVNVTLSGGPTRVQVGGSNGLPWIVGPGMDQFRLSWE